MFCQGLWKEDLLLKTFNQFFFWKEYVFCLCQWRPIFSWSFVYFNILTLLSKSYTIPVAFWRGMVYQRLVKLLEILVSCKMLKISISRCHSWTVKVLYYKSKGAAHLLIFAENSLDIESIGANVPHLTSQSIKSICYSDHWFCISV